MTDYLGIERSIFSFFLSSGVLVPIGDQTLLVVLLFEHLYKHKFNLPENDCQDALVEPARIPTTECLNLCVAGGDGEIGYALCYLHPRRFYLTQ